MDYRIVNSEEDARAIFLNFLCQKSDDIINMGMPLHEVIGVILSAAINVGARYGGENATQELSDYLQTLGENCQFYVDAIRLANKQNMTNN